jgi:hypothetical protein
MPTTNLSADSNRAFARTENASLMEYFMRSVFH